jgi:hypothetical protein
MWQPIETAPRDEVKFLAYDKRDGTMAVCFYWHIVDNKYLSVDGVSGYEWESNIEPTHWMPLPKPPEQLTQSPENVSRADLTNAADTSQNIEHTGD